MRTLILVFLLCLQCHSARFFNGVDQGLVISTNNAGSSSMSASLGKYTYMGWYNLTSWLPTKYYHLGGATDNVHGFYFRINAPGAGHTGAELNWYEQDGNKDLSSAELTWDAGTWYHVCITYDNITMNMYRDAVLIASVANTTANGDGGNATIGDPYNNFAPSTQNPWNGLIDDVKIWGYALTQEQIKNEMLYRMPMAQSCFVYFPMYPGEGRFILDYSGNRHSGGVNTSHPEIKIPNNGNSYTGILDILP